jgi:hypothetical protein
MGESNGNTRDSRLYIFFCPYDCIALPTLSDVQHTVLRKQSQLMMDTSICIL